MRVTPACCYESRTQEIRPSDPRGAREVIVLTEQELEAVTGKDRPSAQARVLRELGIPFRPRPRDGALLVSRRAADAVLGGLSANDETPFEVDVEAIRRHGKKTQERRS